MRSVPWPAGAVAALPLCLLACAASQPSTQEGRTAIATVERDRFCDQDVEQAAASVLRAVRSVEPLYVSERIGKSMVDARLLGARLWLPASEGVTPQWLERTLRCHQAVRTLQPGSAQPAASDPLWLPDGWIDIDVVPERGGFVAALRAENVAEGKQVYARAQAFVAKMANER
jgi:hypothetical protein